MSLSSSLGSSTVDGNSAESSGAESSSAENSAAARAGRAVSGGARTTGPRLRLRGSFAVNELATMFGRLRNLALLAALAAIPLALGVAIKLTTRHGGGGDFISQVSNNGLFLVFSSLTITLPVFLPLALGVVAGDSSRARPARERCATCWSRRWAATGCSRSRAARSSCSASWPRSRWPSRPS